MRIDLEKYKAEMQELTTETLKFEYDRLRAQKDEVSKSKKCRLISILRERGEV